jgi:hypothetical protein
MSAWGFAGVCSTPDELQTTIGPSSGQNSWGLAGDEQTGQQSLADLTIRPNSARVVKCKNGEMSCLPLTRLVVALWGNSCSCVREHTAQWYACIGLGMHASR